ncbi:unnamed protein product [Spodoptera exigua]|nr:unnamed protein product [Spodoptera exigua]
MVSNRRRPWTPATKKELPVRCRPFKDWESFNIRNLNPQKTGNVFVTPSVLRVFMLIAYDQIGKLAYGLPDGKQSAPPMDDRNDGGVTSVLPTEIGDGLGLRVAVAQREAAMLLCKDPNAVYKSCPDPCPETCDTPKPEVCTKACVKNGCECRRGYVLDKINGTCVKRKHCPVNKCSDPHAIYKECPNPCPLTCEHPNPRPCAAMCLREGCECDSGYVLDTESGKCIKLEDCPAPIPSTCGTNEVATSCRIDCPPQTCESIFTSYNCPPTECEPGCNCIDGYLRNSEGVCVPSEECFSGCKGDANATAVSCGSACRSTCADPDRSNRACILICLLNECECKQGYILSESGVCIDPKDCPGGSPVCGTNQTYVSCKAGCPTEYCPTDDSRAMIACSIAYPCPGGCACSPGYLYESYENPQCVLASDCPEVECTRPNEVWDRNPTSCFQERCDERDRDCVDPYPVPPRCVCKKGYYRNESDVCVPASECPSLGCKGDLNATLTLCPTPCPSTCADPNAGSRPCIEICLPEDCQCNPGYVLNEDGKCIKPEDCGTPETCDGDPNAMFSECPSPCQASCDNPDTNQPCIRKCLPSGCVCKPGFIRKKKNGECIKQSSCPVDYGCNGDKNATESDCASACPITCINRFRENNRVCPAVCRNGCKCKPGYILTDDGGVCVKPKDCPVPETDGCDGDPNAVFSDCPSACEPTCENPDSNQPCILMCMPKGCVCKKGFVRRNDGKCVRVEECPAVGCGGDRNATERDCPSPCPLTCADQNRNKPCPAICLPRGCDCNEGYVLTEAGGKCIKPEDCPAEPQCNGDRNATFKECPSACQATCDNPDSDQPCIDVCMPDGCVCKQGYLRIEEDGECVQPQDCPGGSPTCGANKTYVYCKVGCPTNYCPSDDSRAIVACDPIYPCPGGCACKQGYLLRSGEDETCIKASECPPVECTRPNEVWEPNPSSCSCERCEDRGIPCDFPYPVPPRCVCMDGFYRNQDDVCVPESECPAIGCKGDKNATYSECPSPCQPTCDDPDAGDVCITVCDDPGCVCNDDFILSEPGGYCISPYDCPGGSPKCGVNETYVSCKVGGCPSDYCPKDDSLATVICDPFFPCPGGCVCKPGYIRLSEEDNRCVLSSECPPVECTRENEEWNTNPPSCSADRCEYKDFPCDFPIPLPPKCTCIKGYYRNKDDVCVPESECPEPACNGDQNATFSDCPSPCKPTCNSPDSDVICIDMCDEPGCVCNEGFLLTELGGSCIDPYDCPGGSPQCPSNKTYTSCKIDCPMRYCPTEENEIPRICDPLWPCPSGCECAPGYLMVDSIDQTCVLAADCPPLECTGENEEWNSSPPDCDFESCENVNSVCNNISPGRPRCTCKEGYCRNQDGVCVPSEEYPKLNCGYNEVEVPCRQICPPQNCEIAYTDYACTEETEICERGCDCLPDHLRNGSGICIPNNECPYPSTPVCGINEIARDCRRICPPQTCLSKYAFYRCAENIPCEPGCDCVPNYLRDDSGKCIPSEKCPAPCDVPDQCKRTCAVPNPENCDYPRPEENIDGCSCKSGYILTEIGGQCIPIEDCPTDQSCNGDPNAVIKQCPQPCPATCSSPNAFPCKRMCLEVGCECKPGYLKLNETGPCVLPDECPGGNPCGESGRFVDCKVDCPNSYCPIDDSRDTTFCDPSADSCLPGCICNLNHKKRSYEDPTCIVSSDCPPVNCTRPNEVWDPCPSACLAENCEDADKQPTVCNTLVLNCEPRCVCKKKHFRNSSGICVPVHKCDERK